MSERFLQADFPRVVAGRNRLGTCILGSNAGRIVGHVICRGKCGSPASLMGLHLPLPLRQAKLFTIFVNLVPWLACPLHSEPRANQL